MAHVIDIREHILTLGKWLVEHQVKLQRVEEAITHYEDRVQAIENRLTLLEKGWE